MITTPQTRIDKYVAKYLPENFVAQVGNVAELAKADYSAQISDWVSYRDATVVILNSAGVSRILFGHYLGFASLVWRFSQVFKDAALQTAVFTLIPEKVAQGLEQALLNEIAYSVFSVPPPLVP